MPTCLLGMFTLIVQNVYASNGLKVVENVEANYEKTAYAVEYCWANLHDYAKVLIYRLIFWEKNIFNTFNEAISLGA
jgi:hypothetical protein